MAETITVQLNGNPRGVAGNLSVAELLSALDLDPRSVVVELNREIIRKGRLEETPVSDGDSIELVHFVGGG